MREEPRALDIAYSTRAKFSVKLSTFTRVSERS